MLVVLHPMWIIGLLPLVGATGDWLPQPIVGATGGWLPLGCNKSEHRWWPMFTGYCGVADVPTPLSSNLSPLGFQHTLVFTTAPLVFSTLHPHQCSPHHHNVGTPSVPTTTTQHSPLVPSPHQTSTLASMVKERIHHQPVKENKANHGGTSLATMVQGQNCPPSTSQSEHKATLEEHPHWQQWYTDKNVHHQPVKVSTSHFGGASSLATMVHGQMSTINQHLRRQ